MVPQPGQKPISSLAEISIGVHTSSFFVGFVAKGSLLLWSSRWTGLSRGLANHEIQSENSLDGNIFPVFCRRPKGPLGLDHRWTSSIYAESDVCRGTSIMAGVGAVLWKPVRFSGMYRTAASCESRTCASGRTDFGNSIRSGLSYIQEAGTPLVGTGNSLR